jgi:hypothetical protein
VPGAAAWGPSEAAELAGEVVAAEPEAGWHTLARRSHSPEGYIYELPREVSRTRPPRKGLLVAGRSCRTVAAATEGPP